jgi:carboxypeptidase Q
MRVVKRIALALMSVATVAHADPQAPPKDAATRLAGRAIGTTPLASDLAELTDGIGGRPTGSPALEKAVDWGVAKFKAIGIDVKTESYTVPTLWLGGTAEGECTAPAQFPLTLVAAPFSASGTLEAQVIDVGNGTAKDFARAGAKAKGAIIIIGIGEMHDLDDLFAEYLRSDALFAAAKKAGVVGVLLESSHPRGLLYRHPVTSGDTLVPIPVAIVSREQAKRLRRLAAHDTTRVKLAIKNTIGGAYQAKNVVAEIRGREKPDEIVVLGAHLDAWDLGTGANDNGVNAALVIDVARGIKELGFVPKRTIRFVLFTGEEQGMWGSAGYVLSHKAELDKHVAMVVFDVGSGRTTGFFLDGRAELGAALTETLAPVAGLGPFTNPIDGIDGTDNFDFLISGVPNYCANQDATPYLPDYHASSDTFDKVDFREAQANVAIASAVTWGLAERAARPGKRQTRAEVMKLLAATKLDEQMKAFGQWLPFVNNRRGVSN